MRLPVGTEAEPSEQRRSPGVHRGRGRPSPFRLRRASSAGGNARASARFQESAVPQGLMLSAPQNAVNLRRMLSTDISVTNASITFDTSCTELRECYSERCLRYSRSRLCLDHELTGSNPP